MEKFAIYIRVSTHKQDRSGLGLEAQLEACTDFILKRGGEVSKVFKDARTGKCRTRKGLWDAIDYCKETGVALVINKLDRLARDIEFTFRVVNTGVQIHFLDMPVVNTITLGVFAAVAQYERELTSARTKAALQAKKARGEAMCGNPECWGKVTGTKREDAVKLASAAAAASKREKALKNEANIEFRYFIQDWEERFGKIGPNTDWDAICKKLNERGRRTPTGLEYNRTRAMAMYTKIKQLYGQN